MRIEKPWQLDVTALLSQLGCVTVSDVILRKEALGLRLTAEELAILDRYPVVSHDLIEHIPRLENVAKAIRYHRQRLDELTDGLRASDIPLEARILKVAFDFDSLETSGTSQVRALERLQERSGWYDNNVLKALAAAIASEVQWDLKEVGLLELFRMGHDGNTAVRELRGSPVIGSDVAIILAEDVIAEDNALLLSKGQELTPRLIERLRHYATHVRLREPIRVLVPPRRPSPAAVGGR